MSVGEVQDQLTILINDRSRHRNDYLSSLAERDGELGTLNDTIGPGSKKWVLIEEQRLRDQAQYDAIGAQLGRPLQRMVLGGMVFSVMSVLFAAGEAPINQFIFEVALGLTGAMAVVVAFVTAIVLLNVAHRRPHA